MYLAARSAVLHGGHGEGLQHCNIGGKLLGKQQLNKKKQESDNPEWTMANFNSGASLWSQRHSQSRDIICVSLHHLCFHLCFHSLAGRPGLGRKLLRLLYNWNSRECACGSLGFVTATNQQLDQTVCTKQCAITKQSIS